ncbi:MAG: DUF106 domain-containing protein [Candidatus Aenigmarchaeota archaeon]|nr:DUF106 domain-containing protein [Candidatus Aenigmarchaeota archaeon]
MSVAELTLVSAGLALLSALLSRVLVKQDEVRKLKKEVEFYRGKMNEAKRTGNMKEMNEHMKEMSKASFRQMGKNMKATLVSGVVFILALAWISEQFKGVLVQLPFWLPLFNLDMGWFWWYLIVVFVGTFAFRKLLGVE